MTRVGLAEQESVGTDDAGRWVIARQSFTALSSG